MIVLIGVVCGLGGAFLGALIVAWRLRGRLDLAFPEWSEIYFKGYDEGIKAASQIVEDCGFDDVTRPLADRWSTLIRGLYRNPPASITETQE